MIIRLSGDSTEKQRYLYKNLHDKKISNKFFSSIQNSSFSTVDNYVD